MSTIGIRVRQLRKAERSGPEFHPFAVEVGWPKGKRCGYRDAQIVSRHATIEEASSALCRAIRARSGK